MTPARHALTFGAFTYTESISCVLQNSDITVECDISPATINGEPVASDSTGGVATVNVTFWTDSDSVAPTIELAEGWMMTTNWAMTGGDSTMPSWTATLSKPLTATQQS